MFGNLAGEETAVMENVIETYHLVTLCFGERRRKNRKEKEEKRGKEREEGKRGKKPKGGERGFLLLRSRGE